MGRQRVGRAKGEQKGGASSTGWSSWERHLIGWFKVNLVGSIYKFRALPSFPV